MIVDILLIVLALSLAGVSYRLFRGPSLGDRLLALDLIVIIAIAAFCIFYINSGCGFYIELAMLVALAGFVSTLAFCRAIMGGLK